ncbi:DUF1571 domain-containing protein [Paraburkholderia panacisoli]|uniref:DUF1571 domain-containing protein n=1 Tax=Paraburkholderia panacisoli TaxID=2603818 RepID=UPI001FE615B7|nr:DUF1571 domain-containing protein [Paraburkholderia panacisoli]
MRLASLALASAAMIVAPGHAEDAPTLKSHPAPGDQSPIALAQVASLPVERQVVWLGQAARSGELERLDDAQLIELFQALAPDTLSRYVQTGSARYGEYEFQTFSQQRVKGRWQTKPAHMLVRYRQEPRQVYVKWLADGRNAGQEMIYDETKDPDQLYAHLGGILNLASFWVPIDGARVKAQSNHTVRELGIDFFTDLFLAELKKYRAAGVEKPLKIEVLNDHGARVVAFTWETPTGRPDFYAKKERLGLDLRQPFFRTSEAWDNDLELFEKFSFTDVTQKRFDDSVFDPKNPEYRF